MARTKDVMEQEMKKLLREKTMIIEERETYIRDLENIIFCQEEARQKDKAYIQLLRNSLEEIRDMFYWTLKEIKILKCKIFKFRMGRMW
jgi:hypothetical protein